MLGVSVVLLLSSPAAGGTGASRNPVVQPFAEWSIWNLPLGQDASLVHAHMKPMPGTVVDPEIIIHTPNQPLATIYTNTHNWDGGNRCLTMGSAVARLPLPPDLWIASTNGSNPGGLGNGNHVAAVLLEDHRTVWQDLPLTHCIGDNWTCSGTDSTRGDLYAGGQIGAHGGTGMSGLGGSLRLGELVKGGAPIRHALAVAPNCPVNCMACAETPGAAQFRWPAVTGESCEHYQGRVAQLVHGALLALPPSMDIESLGLRTEPGRMIAWTLQNYGAYIVENGTPDIYRFSIECGNAGCVKDEFEAEFGMSMQVENGASNEWQHDVSQVLFPLLHVVDSWDSFVYGRVRFSPWIWEVRASEGAEGSGGGAPLQPWAAPLPPQPLLPIPPSSNGGTLNPGRYVQERESGMCLSLTRNARGRNGLHLQQYDILSLSDCDAAMYPANAWALQGSSGQLVSVPLGGEPLAAHGGCASSEPISASHYGSGFVRVRRY